MQRLTEADSDLPPVNAATFLPGTGPGGGGRECSGGSARPGHAASEWPQTTRSTPNAG